MRKIAIVGPECSGKTTLCNDIALEGKAWCMGEYARIYLNELRRPYAEPDLLAIARGQIQQEEMVMKMPVPEPVPLMVCDTDIITIRIWSEEKYGRCDPWIIQQSEKRHYDLWLLCSPDMPWEPDPLRENPHDRDRLFQVYMAMLGRLKKPYVIVSGGREERLKAALKAIGRP